MNETLITPVRKVIECIESWHNDDYSQWYRIYSDGWCEQGGLFTLTTNNMLVTLFKPYLSDNYTIHLDNCDDPDLHTASSAYLNRTKNSFNVVGGYHGNFFVKEVCWETKGFIA